jgi:hypothetical protein
MSEKGRYWMIIAISVFNTVAIIYLVINHFSYTPAFEEKKVEFQENAISPIQNQPNDSNQSAVLSESDYRRSLSAVKTSLAHAYVNQLSIADSLYREKKYSEARTAYAEAAKLNSNYTYPVDMISLIDMLITDAESEIEPAADTATHLPHSTGMPESPVDPSLNGGDYHIVAGIFSSTRNARKMMDNIRQTKREPIFEPYGETGLFMVIYASFASEAEAEEELHEVRKKITPDAWIMHKSLK